jgi:hypothetical protein
MFTKEQHQLLMLKQPTWDTEPGSPTTGILVGMLAASNVDASRNKLENQQVFSDGFEREFALGNFLSGGNLQIVPNLNSIGHYLKGLCGQDTVTGTVYTIAVTAGGTAYSGSSVVSFTGGTIAGGGAAATATITQVGGVITAVTVTYPGQYTVVPTGVSVTIGTGATFTITAGYCHAMTLGNGNTVPFYLFEDGIPVATNFYRYLSHVFSKLSLALAVEGIMQATFATVGSGTVNLASSGGAPYTASIQPSAAEVVGTPIEYANLTTLEAAADPGTILEHKFDIERKVIQKRNQGKGGKAADAKYGASTLRGTVKQYYESDALWAKARNATITSLQSNLVSGNDQLQILVPEVKLEPTDYKTDGDAGITQEFKYTSIKRANASSPILFNLFNSVATYP